MGWGWRVTEVCSYGSLSSALNDQIRQWLATRVQTIQDAETRDRLTLMYAICAYMVYVANADGVFDDNERALIEGICRELDREIGVGLGTKDHANMVSLAEQSKKAIPRLLQLASQDQGLRYALLRYGWRVAARDSRITEDEFDRIIALGGEMQATNQELVGSSAPYYRAGNDYGARKAALEALGMNDKATLEEIEARYKQLADRYHPNNYSSINEDLMALVVEKYAVVQSAYKQLISKAEPRKLYAKSPGQKQAVLPKRGSNVECYFCAKQVTVPKAGLDKLHMRCAQCQALLFFEADLARIFLQGGRRT